MRAIAAQVFANRTTDTGAEHNRRGGDGLLGKQQLDRRLVQLMIFDAALASAQFE
jgi:hypothetical protein